MEQSFLNYKKNVYSQNGEDGIINYLSKKLKINRGCFCEFGAWDGIHLSNCRVLAEMGWSGLFIEGEKDRYKELVNNYKNNNKIININSWVDTQKNTLDILLKKSKIKSLDFLSIDIDGLDYEIMRSLKIRPRIICIEVNAGHGGLKKNKIKTSIAKNNVGQPLSLFVDLAESMGYGLVCYTGNAFFVRKADIKKYGLSIVSPKVAYSDFVDHISSAEREWLVLVNLGLHPPYYRYFSSDLLPWNINVSLLRATSLVIRKVSLDLKKILIKLS